MKMNAMKKIAMILAALLTLTALLTTGFAAEQAPWYELSFDDTVLTVRLPGENWVWDTMDPGDLELITMEDEGAFVASFMSTANEAKNVALILAQLGETPETTEAVYMIDLNLDAANVITINGVLTNTPSADWVETSDNDEFLMVHLPGADWTYEIIDHELLEVDGIETTDDAYAARFFAPMIKAGTSRVVFISGDGQLTRTIEFFVNEGGGIYPQRIETLDVFVPFE